MARGHRPVIITSLMLCILLVMSSEVMCAYRDSEGVNNDQVFAYAPSQWTQTTQQDFQTGSVHQTDVASSPGRVVLGSVLSAGSSRVYYLAGGNTASFYYYVPTSDTWTKGPDAPGKVNDGGKLTADGTGTLYAFQGGGSTTFWAFNISSGTWKGLANAPGAVNAGADLFYSGGKIYALQGGGTTSVWVFNILAGSWSTLSITGGYTMSSGSSMAVAGSYVYVFRSSSPNFIRVPVTGGAWSSSTAYVAQPPSSSGAGSDIVVVSGTLMLVLDGNGRNLYSYNYATKVWNTLQRLSGSVTNGGGLAYQPSNDQLTASSTFAILGGGDTRFQNYSQDDNAWTSRKVLPVSPGAGAGIAFVFTGAMQYRTSGYFQSSVFDSGQAATVWNSIFWDANLPNAVGQGIIVKARAADNLLSGEPNAQWTTLSTQSAVSGSATYYASLSGLKGQYVQYRVEMTTSDVTLSPAIEEMRLYFVDM